MNQFYDLEKPSISKFIQQGLKIKSQPSDMVMKNILNYSLALSIKKSKHMEIHHLDTIHLILN